MTYAYDIELVAEAAARLVAAIDKATAHPLPDYLHHRFAAARTEAEDVRHDIANQQENRA